MQTLTTTGVANKDDLAFHELLQHHSVSDPPNCTAPKSISLVVDETPL